ncbi:hypothetical protein JP39_07680 [Companilactobacillus heilongjiangensis]|uniref:Uncharacterized protein n=1 Tax=Companilactobacillus heilongjiangensis TaxID=1074467 RepID=A0A0K2LD72_9LACO|nr:hypothetical protein JP39_07680 [Companilactobacillus heilongjiangensis]
MALAITPRTSFETRGFCEVQNRGPRPHYGSDRSSQQCDKFLVSSGGSKPKIKKKLKKITKTLII